MRLNPAQPFALSLSKGCPCFCSEGEKQGFDKLSPNGFDEAGALV
jgi:hypothetical protein